MSIYWLTRLDDIRSVLIGILILGIIGIILFISLIIAYSSASEKDTDGYFLTKKGAIISGIISILATLGIIFTPTTKQALIIYGVKEGKEYIERNPNVKELPDKIVKALDAYLESEIKENNEEQQ